MSTQPRRRRLDVQDYDNEISIINFVDRRILDEQNIQKIGEDLFSLVDEYGRKKIVLNFANVEYLSSAALGKLITLNRKVNNAGGKLAMCNINEDIFEVFTITNLDRMFNIYPDEQTALQAF